MTETETYYKTLTRDGVAPYSDYAWPLPTKQADGTWLPGEWTPAIEGELVACEQGYHGCTLAHLLDWLNDTMYVLEYRRPPVTDGNKVVGRQARLLRPVEAWNERTARLLAADCAERVLPLYEQVHPGDDRPRQTIAVARRFADGRATAEELAAARSAAVDAARDAARDVSRVAAWAAQDAASAAAWAAARDAAGDAAWAAARAAARDAASAAAWAAARDGAWAAERAWQVARLAWYLAGEVSDGI